MRYRRILLSNLTALFCILGFQVGTGGMPAFAQEHSATAVTPDISASLNQAARTSPGALVAKLEEILRAHPDLAASPSTAADLARAASQPVGQFLGANVPVYRDIAARIINAAPEDVRPKVADAVALAVREVASTDPMVTRPLVRNMESLLAEAGQHAERASTKRGIKAGSFTIYPEMQVSEYYDDNIYATKTDTKSDFVTVVGPHVFVVSNWEKNFMRFQAHLDDTRYASHHNEDSDDFWLADEGRYDLTDNANLFGGLLYGRWHEDRSSPDVSISGTKPTLYREGRAYAGASQKLGKAVFRIGGTFERLRFYDTPTATGFIDNEDRDRDHITVGGSVGYQVTDVFTPYVDVTLDQRRYRTHVDDYGYNRDSHGYKAVVGTKATVRGVLDGEAYIGYWRQKYDDTALQNVSMLVVGGNARWRFVPSTLLITWLDRSIEETTLPGASAYIYTGSGAALEHEITPKLSLIVRGGYSLSTFQGIDRKDNDYEAGTTLRYSLFDNYYVATDYRFEKRISNVSSADYKRNLIYLRVGALF